MNDETRSFSDDETVDAVIVGTGAGGAPILAALARAGLRVVALEAGEHRDPLDHTPDETEASGDLNWMAERLSGGADPTAFGANNSGRGVGGSTLHWGAFTPRPDARDLRLRTEFGVGADWPIDPRAFAGHLRDVERFIGVSGPAHYPWDPERTYDMPAPARNAPAEAVLRGSAVLGIRAVDAPAAVLTRDRGARRACVGAGSCHQGCRTSAKASTATTYLPDAVAHGAEIRDGSTVIGFELDARGRIAAVVYRRDGVERRQRAAVVFLAAGGVETPRLLLHTGLANSSGQVGRNFMVHGATQIWARFDEPMRGYRGYPSSVISEDFVRPADADFAGGYLFQSLGVMPLTYGANLVRGAGLRGRDLVTALEDYPFRGGIGINAEGLPADGNRLELTDEIDDDGMPRVRATYSAGENEKRIDAHAERTMRAVLDAAGGRDLIRIDRTAHTLGTCRMGDDPSTSVVGPDGRAWDIPNLYVCDNSVFPSSLSANPALATMALAHHVAERFLAA